MKVYNFLTVIVALLAFAGIGRAAQIPSVPTPGLAVPTMPVPTIPTPTTPLVPTTPALGGVVQIAAELFTEAVLEPNGSVAVCFATNLDSGARDLAAQIIDANGVNVTQTSSCGARLASGVTCESTAHFANNSPLRCVVGTSGNAMTLRGGMITSTNGAFPFTSPAHLNVPAH
jgi:hypothetical protein